MTKHAEALSQAATKAGLTDMDLLKLADPGKSPDEAVTALKARYPGAFGQKQFRDMTPEEKLTFRRKTGLPLPRRGIRT